MIREADNRNGSDRRDGNVSHLTIMNKLVEHDELILKQQEAGRMMARDIKDIKTDLHPITKGVNSIVWLGRFIVAVGAVAAALVGIDAFLNTAQASGSTSSVVINNHGSHSSYDSDDVDQGIAAALAAGSCQFDYSHAKQGCVGVGNWEDENAISLQGGMRVGDTLINGGAACDTDFDICGFTGAVNFHF